MLEGNQDMACHTHGALLALPKTESQLRVLGPREGGGRGRGMGVGRLAVVDAEASSTVTTYHTHSLRFALPQKVSQLRDRTSG